MQSKPGSTKMVEKVNQGPSGARKGSVGPGHGQGSDGGGKDELVPLTPMQHDPYKARGEDWPVKDVDASDGQSGPRGTAVGQNELIKDSVNQCGPRHIEDEGPGEHGSGTPTNWTGSGGRASTVAAAFPIETNKGEANQEGSEVGIPESVDLETGMIMAKGYSQTRVKEVPEATVSIGR